MARQNLKTAEVSDFLHVLCAMDSEDEIYAFLEDVLTIREIRDSSQRLAVARLLDSGKSYTAIERETGASATTIARVSKCLGYGSGGYRAALDILEAANRGEGADPADDDAAASAIGDAPCAAASAGSAEPEPKAASAAADASRIKGDSDARAEIAANALRKDAL